jgi:hypothetical protein
MGKLFALLAAGVLFSGLSFVVAADDAKKTVTLTGDGLCAKCALKEAKTCQNAVIVTKNGKKTTYYLEPNALSKAAHQKLGFCSATKEDPAKVKVTGTVEEKDGKHILTLTKAPEKAE